MKSQDVLLLLKLVCLSHVKMENIRTLNSGDRNLDTELNQINSMLDLAEHSSRRSTLRCLSEELGISKSEISNSLKRSVDAKLAKFNRLTGKPEVNKKAFEEFIRCGFKYVFPVKPAQLTRGIQTTFLAPVLGNKLFSAGDSKMVWPDSRGKDMGQAIEPLYKSAPFAARRDNELYAYLALLDSIRMGSARECKLATEAFTERLLQ